MGSPKVARLHGQHFAPRRAAMDEIAGWLGFYNARRLHSTLDYVSPMTFEKTGSPLSRGKPHKALSYGIRETGARSQLNNQSEDRASVFRASCEGVCRMALSMSRATRRFAVDWLGSLKGPFCTPPHSYQRLDEPHKTKSPVAMTGLSA
jgi:hypothetical protein